MRYERISLQRPELLLRLQSHRQTFMYLSTKSAVRLPLQLSLEASSHSVVVHSEARCVGTTGVEMEALTAASVAALTVYDMCKAVSKGIVISDVRLEYKSGGKGGTWQRRQ